MSGTKYSPIAFMIGTAKRNIIVVPCVVKSWLYRSGPRSVFSGRASCSAHQRRLDAAGDEHEERVMMYRFAIVL